MKREARFRFGKNFIVATGQNMGTSLKFLRNIVENIVSIHILRFAG
jgi:hypothetical protein